MAEISSRVLIFSDSKRVEEQVSILEQQLFNMPLDFASLTEETIDEHYEQIEKVYKATYEKIIALQNTPEKLSFQTVVQPLIDLELVTSKVATICSFPAKVHPNKSIRDKSNDISEDLEKLEIQYDQDPKAYQIFEQYFEGPYQKEKESLHPEQQRYFEHHMRDCRRRGMHIKDEKTKAEIKKVLERLSELCLEFEHNCDEENTHFIYSEKDLEGLPESWFLDHEEAIVEKKETEEPDLYKVTLKYPDYYPIMDYVKNRDIRKTMYNAFETRCEKENVLIFKEILSLRQELARLTGYPSYPDYVTEPKMAKNAKTVANFLSEMRDRFSPIYEKDLKELTEFARTIERDPAFNLEYYDMRYYARLHKEATYQVDLEAIKQYFPVGRTVEATLSIYQRLLNLKFKEIDDKTKWHEDVRVFEVYDIENPNRIGLFYLDLFPREGKYNHACVSDLSFGADISHFTGKKEERSISYSSMLCNFPKTGGLSFEDVVTFFHEFGHLMHTICSKTKLPGFNGFNVEQDFVEAPSQMLENWCYEPSVLKILSAHIETGEALPDDVAKKLKKLDKSHIGYQMMRFLTFGTYDFEVHSLRDKELEDLNIKKFFQHLKKQLMKLTPTHEECFPASFEHLVGDYDVGYYGYLMSEIYSVDMYSSVFKKDPLSQEAGLWYRKCILEPGASVDAMELLKNFLGREPKIDAFLEEFGLKSSAGYGNIYPKV